MDKDAGIVRIPIDEAMRLTARARTAVRSPEGAQAMKTRSLRSSSCRSCAAVASAQMASGPDIGYKREAGMVSSALPAPLREIGFDQNIGQRLPLDTPVRDEDGRTVQIGDVLRQASGRADLRLLQLPDAVLAGDQRPRERARRALARARTRPRNRHGQLRSARHAADGSARRRPAISSATAARAPRRPSHFLTADQPAIDAADKGGGLPLCVGRGDAAVRAPERRHRADAGWPPGALHVRHRVRSARSPAGARRSLGGQGRHRRRYAAALLLSLRPDDGPLRPRGHARAARGGRRHGSGARYVRIRHDPARKRHACGAARRGPTVSL